ncbi:MAG: hypothetical protein KAF40_00965 [Flavihumibacter sp.]|nr:hypothetical protein [Flavihumibacter sp.]
MKHNCFPNDIYKQAVTLEKVCQLDIDYPVEVSIHIMDIDAVSKALLFAIEDTMGVTVQQMSNPIKYQPVVTARQLYIYFMTRITPADYRTVSLFTKKPVQDIRRSDNAANNYLLSNDAYFTSCFNKVKNRLFELLYENKTDTCPVQDSSEYNAGSLPNVFAKNDVSKAATKPAVEYLQAPP